MSELSARDLTVGYRGVATLSGVEFTVRAGRVTVLIGPNGSGKTTLLRSLAGKLETLGGGVYLDGKELRDVSLAARARRLAVMTTSRRSPEYARCFDVVAVGRYQFTGSTGKLRDSDVLAVEEALEAVGALELKEADYEELSDGQKQRVLLARAVAQEPKVMLLDEPTSFLDVGYKLEFVNALRRLVRERELAVLASLHELELARSIADEVVCVGRDGRVDKIAPPDEVFQVTYLKELFGVKGHSFEEVYGGVFSGDGNRRLASGSTISEISESSTSGTFTAPRVMMSSSARRTKFIMVQGTTSNAGKSLITAGLCRVFAQDGLRVAPFKSQNMALNSYVTSEGLEMGRAQVMQAEAAGIEPSVSMNPILLKPTSDCGSQVIVNGRVVGNMRAREYFDYKRQLVPEILKAVARLEENADVIVIEGAGSPAEINLKSNDIVNMGMASLVDAPVMLVGDIDRGGVFAQLLGTLELLDASERGRVKGLVVNKFRGDPTLLEPGIKELEERVKVPVVGVLPYLEHSLDDEDSLAERFTRRRVGVIRLGVVKLPHVSNFTDFNVFDQFSAVEVSYLSTNAELHEFDMVALPGTKNTVEDMRWLHESGLGASILRYHASGGVVFGICGGLQILGESIADPEGVEAFGDVAGLGLLPVRTRLRGEKRLCQCRGRFLSGGALFDALVGREYVGYEIHMGETEPTAGAEATPFTEGGTGFCGERVFGTYVHGIFDAPGVAKGVVEALARRRGVELELADADDYAQFKEREYDKLAAMIRKHMKMEAIYDVLALQ